MTPSTGGSDSEPLLKMTPERFHRSLGENQFATVPTTISRTDLEAAADSFLAFLSLPEGLKQKLHFPVRRHRATADGYTDRTDLSRKDSKLFFHWSPALRKQKECRIMRQQEPVVDQFFEVADRTYRHAEDTLHAIYSQFLPDYREHVFEGGRLIDGTLRFLCYVPGPEETLCAKAHYDKGFSTLALGDSAPGLRIGRSEDEPLVPVTHRNGHAIFMPAWMLFQASRGRIRPAWHDVVHQPGEQNVNSLCARWSIVLFVNDPRKEFSSWNTVHTSLH